MVSLIRTLSVQDGIHAALGTALAVIMISTGAEASSPCADVLPPVTMPASVRDVAPDDLLRLRDIGVPEGGMVASHSPLSVSPDGRSLAFLVNRAHPETNSYCRALVVLDVATGKSRVVDTGGELITLLWQYAVELRGHAPPASQSNCPAGYMGGSGRRFDVPGRGYRTWLKCPLDVNAKPDATSERAVAARDNFREDCADNL